MPMTSQSQTGRWLMTLAAALCGAAGASAQSFGSLSDATLLAPVPVGPVTQAVAIADLNRDGMQDVAAAGEGGSGQVWILRGAGDGTFSAAGNFQVGWSAIQIVPADFDRDGDLDLAVGNGGGFRIFLNDGSGAFTAGGQFQASNTFAIAVADFNCDGRLDVVAGSADAGGVLYRGNGDGTFTYATSIERGDAVPGGPLRTVATGDFNRDGRPDIAMGRVGNAGLADRQTVLIALNTGTAGAISFAKAQGVSTTSLHTWELAAGDFNVDGRLDLAAVNNERISVFHGNGNGTFGAEIIRPLSGARYIATADLDGDARLDLAVTTTGGVSVLRNEGAGMFTESAPLLSVPGVVRGIALGDVNCDGRPDLAMARPGSSTQANRVGVRLNTTVW